MGAPLAALVLLTPGTGTGAGAEEFGTERLVGPGVIDRPVFLTAPPGDRERVFIVEQHTGEVLILNLDDRSLEASPFVTIPNLSTGNEQGLLGLAFHPSYAENGFFYVNYTAGSETVIARLEVSGDPNTALPGQTRVLGFSQPQSTHNGGWIGFGPQDGLLYVATGDGGGSDDNDSGHTAGSGNAQDITNNLLGKILRVDVDGDDFPLDPDRNYAIPATNPFVGITGDDEIWSFGLRNPFRASFDRQTGHLYIGDVGQQNREEIDLQPAMEGGHDFGWRLREGTIATPTGGVGGPKPAGALDPIYDYPHSGGGGFTGCSVVGGYVYRGPIALLAGVYFFADYCTSRIWSLRFDGSDPTAFDGTNYTDLTDHTGDPRFTPDVGSFAAISSFGEDDAGNLYIVKLGSRDQSNALIPNSGEIFAVPEPASPRIAIAAILALAALRTRYPRTRARR